MIYKFLGGNHSWFSPFYAKQIPKMGRACDPKFGKGATTGIKGQPTGSCSPAIWGTTNKLFPFAINDATQNNSSLMLNNFTTSIFSRYVWAIWRRWAGVSLCCLHIGHIFEHLPREDELRWEEYMQPLTRQLTFIQNCQLDLQTLTSGHFRPFCLLVKMLLCKSIKEIWKISQGNPIRGWQEICLRC